MRVYIAAPGGYRPFTPSHRGNKLHIRVSYDRSLCGTTSNGWDREEATEHQLCKRCRVKGLEQGRIAVKPGTDT